MAAATTIQKRYVIVGAGPAGLQMGYYMEKHGLDYIVLEVIRRICNPDRM